MNNISPDLQKDNFFTAGLDEESIEVALKKISKKSTKKVDNIISHNDIELVDKKEEPEI